LEFKKRELKKWIWYFTWAQDSRGSLIMMVMMSSMEPWLVPGMELWFGSKQGWPTAVDGTLAWRRGSASGHWMPTVGSECGYVVVVVSTSALSFVPHVWWLFLLCWFQENG
jgi:hypothetical protein